MLTERWRKKRDTIEPHNSPGYRPQAFEVIRPFPPALRSAPAGGNGFALS